MQQNHTVTDWQIEVFYDGDCPLCRREIAMLRRMDRKRQIRFTDIAAVDFQASSDEVSWDDLMSEIHGRLPDGSWIRGVEVFRRLYSAVGWGPLVRLSRLPLVSSMLAWGYRLFARNRLRWTGRCAVDRDGCDVKPRQASQEKPVSDTALPAQTAGSISG
jgi:predicted DCC family thiol-disulfide oxidoreductase YuxK